MSALSNVSKTDSPRSPVVEPYNNKSGSKTNLQNSPVVGSHKRPAVFSPERVSPDRSGSECKGVPISLTTSSQRVFESFRVTNSFEPPAIFGISGLKPLPADTSLFESTSTGSNMPSWMHLSQKVDDLAQAQWTSSNPFLNPASPTPQAHFLGLARLSPSPFTLPSPIIPLQRTNSSSSSSPLSQSLFSSSSSSPAYGAPLRSLIAPDVGAFAPTLHQELVKASPTVSDQPRRMSAPSAPSRKKSAVEAPPHHLIVNARGVLAGLQSMQPFSLSVSAEKQIKVIEAKKLESLGLNSDVYLCNAEDGERYVIKVFKEDTLKDNALFISKTACQMMRYFQTSNHDVLKDHVAIHWNFEPHREAIQGFLKMEAGEQFKAFQGYVRDRLQEGFTCAEYTEKS